MRGAIIAAIVAAVVAASTATATTTIVITGAQIKNGTIQAKDLSASARRSLRGQRGPRGLSGTAGAAGSQGAQGPAGANGGFNPAKVSFRVGPTTTIVAGSVFNSLSVTCAPGETAIAGGFFSSVGYAYNDRPGGDRVSWSILIDASDYLVNGSGEGYVVCAAP
jgi:hypothetical protein